MFEYKNETDILSLMLDKNKFLQYIIKKYTEKNCCTPLEPQIWAIHFNIPKYQRLPLLENIILQSIKFIRTQYSFLPEKQILGKTYEALGIPTVCGEPNKLFLNTYKKYKSYYPLKYPKNENTSFVVNNLCLDNIYGLDEIRTNLNYNDEYSTSMVNQGIISSTPKSKRSINFDIIPLLSPINTAVIYEYKQSPTVKNSPHTKYQVLNTLNITQNSIHHDTDQLVSKPNNLELSGFNILNNTFQKLQQTFFGTEKVDETKMICLTMVKNSKYFNNRNVECNQIENNISQNNITNNLNEICNEKCLEEDMKNKIITSIYHDNKKKIKRKSKSRKILTQNLKQKPTPVLKHNLKIKKLKNNGIEKALKTNFQNFNSKSVNKSYTLIKTEMAQHNDRHKNKNIPMQSKSNIKDSWIKMKQTFSDTSFSDLDKTILTPIKINQWTNKCRNKIEQGLVKLEYEDAQRKNKTNYGDVKFENQNNTKRITDHKIICNSRDNTCVLKNKFFPNTSNLPHNNKNKKYIPSISYSLSDNSVFCPNSTSNFSQLDIIKQEFMNGSLDSDDVAYYEKSKENKKVNILFKNIQFKELSCIQSEENINMSSLSINNSTLSSTVNSPAIKSNFNEKMK